MSKKVELLAKALAALPNALMTLGSLASKGNGGDSTVGQGKISSKGSSHAAQTRPGKGKLS